MSDATLSPLSNHPETVPDASGPTETALLTWLDGDRLLMILCQPATRRSADLGVVYIVGGPQYRAGSHRQFVQSARAVAAAGFPTLRFDVRGMGDSTGALHGFEQIDDDIDLAIATLRSACPELRRIVLWGLCDGASAALLYLQRRPRRQAVNGLCLINPWVRSAETLAASTVKQYYSRRIFDPSLWMRLLQGRVSIKTLRTAGRNVGAMLRARLAPVQPDSPSADSTIPFVDRMAMALADFSEPGLLVLSQHDFTASEFREVIRHAPSWRAARRRIESWTWQEFDADHTFSGPGAADSLDECLIAWLSTLVAVPRQSNQSSRNTARTPRGESRPAAIAAVPPHQEPS